MIEYQKILDKNSWIVSVTRKASDAKNTDVNNFKSFKFVIFKYPNETNG